MKKLILSLVILVTMVTNVSAQHYRGFVDFNISLPISNTGGHKFESFAGTIGGTTSHGVQLNRLFVGAGAGAVVVPSGYGVGVPVFAEARCDFFGVRTTNLFIGCKLGWLLNVGDEYGINLEWRDDYGHGGWIGYGNMYIQPSVGMRFRITNTIGINLALSYLPLQFNGENFGYYDIVGGGKFKFWSHRIAFSVGLDF